MLFYLSVIVHVYEGTSNCFMFTYFMDMLFGFLFWHFICRNIKMLDVYLFQGNASCLHFSQCTILLSGTLYVGTSNCLMSTYFTCLLSTFFTEYYLLF